ncbi:MAG TPA: c-type cytochrome [Bryobacteraceae bacterium]|nr:c-type cytochrome [Bryobacteraceae bacterium]
MRDWKLSFAIAGALVTGAAQLMSQEPAVTPAASKPGAVRGPGATAETAASAAAIAGSKENPAAVERGAKLYTAHCAGCHGAAAKGGPGAPDLVRSLLVLDDEKGILIAPVLREGRPDKGMPRPNLTEPQIADVVAWLHVQTYAAGHRGTYVFQDVVTGNAKKGEAYFSANCSSCHSATGDLAGIAKRHDPFSLQGRWLQPRGGRGGRGRGAAASGRTEVTATVTLANGQAVSGKLEHIDDFNIAVREPNGEYHSFTREGDMPRVEIHDPLKAHNELLHRLTDADIHNVTAYLVTLK